MESQFFFRVVLHLYNTNDYSNFYHHHLSTVKGLPIVYYLSFMYDAWLAPNYIVYLKRTIKSFSI